MPQAWRAGNPKPAVGSGEATGRVPSPVPAMETPGFAVPCGPRASKTNPQDPETLGGAEQRLTKHRSPKMRPLVVHGKALAKTLKHSVGEQPRLVPGFGH